MFSHIFSHSSFSQLIRKANVADEPALLQIMPDCFRRLPQECKDSNCFRKTADYKDYFTWERITRLQLEGSNALSHILAYVVMTVLFTLSVKSFPSLRSGLAIFFVILAIGTVDELTQPFFSRTMNVTDWLADLLGIVTALAVLVFLKKKKLNLLSAKSCPLTAENFSVSYSAISCRGVPWCLLSFLAVFLWLYSVFNSANLQLASLHFRTFGL